MGNAAYVETTNKRERRRVKRGEKNKITKMIFWLKMVGEFPTMTVTNLPKPFQPPSKPF
jgi:hypothetical protein